MYQINLLLGLMSLSLYSLTLFALPEDVKATIYIHADSTLYHYKTGETIYEGHVKVDQGTTHIMADRMITKTNFQHHIKEAIAYGLQNMAEYTTVPKLKEPIIHAAAKMIKFYPFQSNVLLEENVTVMQGNNRFQGERIYYDGLHQTIMVLPTTGNKQSLVVYAPNSE